jgi:hypothetical protein
VGKSDKIGFSGGDDTGENVSTDIGVGRSLTREPYGLETPDHSFNFKVTRWFGFYNKLKAYMKKNSDGLAEQLKLFMEENHMLLGNQFRSTDLVAMENYLSAPSGSVLIWL